MLNNEENKWFLEQEKVKYLKSIDSGLQLLALIALLGISIFLMLK
jgi:hypothetical protein